MVPDWAWVVLGIVGCLGLLFGILVTFGPRREIVGVDAEPEVSSTLRFTPTATRTYRFWGRVDAACDDDSAGILADVGAECGGADLLAPSRLDTFGSRWWVTSTNDTCRFTVRLWTSPVLERDRPVAFRARILGGQGSPVVKARVYVST